MIRISIILSRAKETLNNKEIDEREARLLLAFAMGINSDELIKYTEVPDDVKEKFDSLVERRISGEPYAYITGLKEFMKLDFKVDNNVLIPRPETELLVEEALNINATNILDMCTGSGCIAISIAHNRPNANVTAVDVSEEALKIAKENAINNNVNVNFLHSDLFENIDEKYDLIVSNPPYIKSNEIDELQKEVKREPRMALDGGTSGLDFYEKIAKEAKKYLNENGTLMFEIGYDQGQAVKEILEKNNYKNIEIKKDLSKKDRIIICEK